jgi:hypothetical protein
MFRRITAVGSAALLAFTLATTPLYAADLGMPTKAPVYKAPPAEVVEEFCWPCVLALLAAAGLGVCLAECGCLKSCHHCECVTQPCSCG